MSMKRPKIPALVKKVRDSLGETQQQFANRLGVDVITVSRWERGKSEPIPLLRREIEKLEAGQ